MHHFGKQFHILTSKVNTNFQCVKYRAFSRAVLGHLLPQPWKQMLRKAEQLNQLLWMFKVTPDSEDLPWRNLIKCCSTAVTIRSLVKERLNSEVCLT